MHRWYWDATNEPASPEFATESDAIRWLQAHDGLEGEYRLMWQHFRKQRLYLRKF